MAKSTDYDQDKSQRKPYKHVGLSAAGIQNPPTMKCSQRFLTQYRHKLTDVPVLTFTLEVMMRTCLQSKLSRF